MMNPLFHDIFQMTRLLNKEVNLDVERTWFICITMDSFILYTSTG